MRSSHTAVEFLVFGLGTGGSIGAYGYSWDFAMRAFLPVIERIGPVRLIDRPESQLDYWARDARRRGRMPLALSFRPFQDAHLIRGLPTINYCFWEFPDVPLEPLWHNPRFNWGRMAGEVAMILCGSTLAADAFRRAGVTTPLRVIPPPLPPHWFEPADAGSSAPEGEEVSGTDAPREPPLGAPPLGKPPESWRTYVLNRLEFGLWTTARLLTPPLLYSLARGLKRGVFGRALRVLRRAPAPPAFVATKPGATRAGDVVFTSVFNPLDGRKAWHDVLSAFAHVLGDRADAVLLLKFASPPDAAAEALVQARRLFRACGLRSPACRVIVVPGRLDDEQMRGLAEATTWYVNGTRAEGCCLPLLEMMAAGRPAISPAHSAMSDYFTDRAGLSLQSEAVPTDWPGNPTGRHRTTWHQLSWTSLCAAFRKAYAMARQDPDEYARLAAGAVAAARAWASAPVVEARLREAIAAVLADRWPTQEVA